MSWEKRHYDTKDQMEQAIDDLVSNGSNITWSSSGGESDGTGGEYIIEIQR
jgi:hypothetical protein